MEITSDSESDSLAFGTQKSVTICTKTIGIQKIQANWREKFIDLVVFKKKIKKIETILSYG